MHWSFRQMPENKQLVLSCANPSCLRFVGQLEHHVDSHLGRLSRLDLHVPDWSLPTLEVQGAEPMVCVPCTDGGTQFKVPHSPPPHHRHDQHSPPPNLPRSRSFVLFEGDEPPFRRGPLCLGLRRGLLLRSLPRGGPGKTTTPTTLTTSIDTLMTSCTARYDRDGQHPDSPMPSQTPLPPPPPPPPSPSLPSLPQGAVATTTSGSTTAKQ